MPKAIVDGLHINYQLLKRDGSKEHISLPQTLVFIPGGAGMVDYSLYVPFWSRFVDIGQVLFYDPVGCGGSDDGNKEQWSITAQANFLNKLCHELQINNPIVAGVSWGGYIALSYAIQFPEELQGLIVCNSEAKVFPEHRADKFRQLGGDNAAEAVYELDHNWSWEATSNYFEQCLPYYACKNPYKLSELENAGRQNKELFEFFFREEHRAFNFLNQLPVIKCPVLQLVGSHDPVHPEASARETHKHFKEGIAELTVIDGVGDPVYRDEPDLVAQKIKDFFLKLMGNPLK